MQIHIQNRGLSTNPYAGLYVGHQTSISEAEQRASWHLLSPTSTKRCLQASPIVISARNGPNTAGGQASHKAAANGTGHMSLPSEVEAHLIRQDSCDT